MKVDAATQMAVFHPRTKAWRLTPHPPSPNPTSSDTATPPIVHVKVLCDGIIVALIILIFNLQHSIDNVLLVTECRLGNQALHRKQERSTALVLPPIAESASASSTSRP